jgi:hypothetical protein
LPIGSEAARYPAPGLQAWIAAQADGVLALASAAAALGALDQRLRQSGPALPGLTHRLALVETAALCQLAREPRAEDDLARDSAATQAAGRPTRVGRLVAQLTAAGDAADPAPSDPGLHPLVTAMRSLTDEPGQGWYLAAAAASAARLAAAGGRGGLRFVPLAEALQAHGTGPAALSEWLGAVECACSRSLALIDRVERWRDTAAAAVADWSGRTPALLIEALARWPVATAALAETEAGVSRAAVQRNLDRLVGLGLVREVTGRGRYRIWAAALPDQSI